MDIWIACTEYAIVCWRRHDGQRRLTVIATSEIGPAAAAALPLATSDDAEDSQRRLVSSSWSSDASASSRLWSTCVLIERYRHREKDKSLAPVQMCVGVALERTLRASVGHRHVTSPHITAGTRDSPIIRAKKILDAGPPMQTTVRTAYAACRWPPHGETPIQDDDRQLMRWYGPNCDGVVILKFVFVCLLGADVTLRRDA